MKMADRFRREDARERTRRDLQRYARRVPGGGFWHGVALIGSVGWPIVLLATGGAMLGHSLDRHWATGIHFTLMLLTLGTVLGTWMAFRSLRDKP
ncbi:MAG: AtpZ/AtpI family protein [Alcanivorax sp.]|nr:AtpZ/AtpI family protein [Alcanivorax sp.]